MYRFLRLYVSGVAPLPRIQHNIISIGYSNQLSFLSEKLYEADRIVAQAASGDTIEVLNILPLWGIHSRLHNQQEANTGVQHVTDHLQENQKIPLSAH